jgi:hypothetical protein
MARMGLSRMQNLAIRIKTILGIDDIVGWKTLIMSRWH